jgi:UDP-glucose 4-epimerase
MNRVLITGGTGYIGSHVALALIQAGQQPVLLDNLSGSGQGVLERLRRITGQEPLFVRADVRDAAALDAALARHRPVACIHCAGLKAVAESVDQPLRYYANNVEGTLVLLGALRRAGVPRILFSSSATVYGLAQEMPVAEDAVLQPINPYGRGKVMVEEFLADLTRSGDSWRAGILRYFNPVGAHESGLLGEEPSAVLGNLMPILLQVAAGERGHLDIFGMDYDTPDGTCIRDFVHVMDVAEAHVQALDRLLGHGGLFTVNLGTGRGWSVLEAVRTFERVTGRSIAWRAAPRRPGDIPVCYAAVAEAQRLLGWSARRGLEDMCADAWRWRERNPAGHVGRPDGPKLAEAQ